MKLVRNKLTTPDGLTVTLRNISSNQIDRLVDFSLRNCPNDSDNRTLALVFAYLQLSIVSVRVDGEPIPLKFDVADGVDTLSDESVTLLLNRYPETCGYVFEAVNRQLNYQNQIKSRPHSKATH